MSLSKRQCVVHATLNVVESLEDRRLFALPVLIDFASGTSLSQANYNEAGGYSVSANTTPAHQTAASGGGGGLATNADAQVYNRVGGFNVASGLQYGDGSASGLTLTWGSATAAGQPITWANGTPANLSTQTVAANASNKEFNQTAYLSGVSASVGATVGSDGIAGGIEAIKIGGLPAGTYTVYLTNQTTDTKNEMYANQIGVNLNSYSDSLSHLTGPLVVDGKFTSPGEYTVVTLAINAGENLVIATRGLGTRAGTARFNLLEIIPAGTDTTAKQPIVNAVSSGYTALTAANAYGELLGGNGNGDALWAMDYQPSASWYELKYSATMVSTWGPWVNDTKHPGRNLIVSVPMFAGPADGSGSSTANDIANKWDGPVNFTDGAAGKWDSAWQGFGKNLVAAGLSKATIRIGWEMNAPWFSWTAKTNPAGYAAYFQRIVNVLRNVAGQQFKFSWSPNVANEALTGTGSFDARSAYPGDAYVDAIGIDFYDWDDATNYPPTNPASPPTVNQQERATIRQISGLTQGLQFFADFARLHNKVIHLAEWGTSDRVNKVHSGMDNPTFVRLVHHFAADPANNVAVQTYFNQGGDGNHQLTPYVGGAFSKFNDDDGASRTTQYTPIFPRATAQLHTNFNFGPKTLPLGGDLGGPAVTGLHTYGADNNAWTVIAGGSGFGEASDQFHFAGQSASGDRTAIARLQALTDTGTAPQAGLMMRDGTANNPTAAFAAVTFTPGVGYTLDYRNAGGSAGQVAGTAFAAAPGWVKLVRVGNAISAYYATIPNTLPTAKDWKLIGQANVTLSATYSAGLAVAANDPVKTTTATFANFTITQPGITAASNSAPAYFAGPLMQADADIGAPAGIGSVAYAGGQYRIVGGGGDIGGSADQFNFDSTVLLGDATLITRVTGQTVASGNSKAGLMFRDSAAAGAINALVAATPTGGVKFQWRSAVNGATTAVTVGNVSSPVWLKLVRTGSNFTAFYATTTNTPATADWKPIGTAVTLNLSPPAQAGLAVSAAAGGTATSAATFTNLSIANTGGALITSGNVIINSGTSPGRSVVRTASLQFSLPVVLGSDTLVLTRTQDGANIPFTLTNPSNDLKTYVLTFADPTGPNGTLADGNYVLKSLTSGQSFAFHRLLADSNGDRVVDFNDFLLLQNAFGTQAGSPGFDESTDYDLNGVIDFNDFLILQNRFNQTI